MDLVEASPETFNISKSACAMLTSISYRVSLAFGPAKRQGCKRVLGGGEQELRMCLALPDDKASKIRHTGLIFFLDDHAPKLGQPMRMYRVNLKSVVIAFVGWAAVSFCQ